VAGYEENTQQCLRSFSTPELKSPYQITPITIFQKCHSCHPWPEIDAKVGHFPCKCFRPLAIALLFRRGKFSLQENPPSSSKNVTFTNGKTDRFFVPYRTIPVCLAMFTHFSSPCGIRGLFLLLLVLHPDHPAHPLHLVHRVRGLLLHGQLGRRQGDRVRTLRRIPDKHKVRRK
jgi:hypothetical protein